MKRPYKIALWVTASIVLLLILALTTVSAILFNSRNLSSVVISQLNKQDRFEFSMQGADVVIFKTFPEISLHLAGFSMVDIASGDTLAVVPDLFAAIDVKAFLKNNELIIRKVSLDNVYTDVNRVLSAFSTGAEEEEPANEPFNLPFNLINISAVEINNLHIVYGEHAPGTLMAELQGLDLEMQLNTYGNKGEGSVKLDLPLTDISISDTVYCSRLPLSAEIPFDADLDSMKIRLQDALLTIAGQRLRVDGTVAMPTSQAESPIDLNLNLILEQWNIAEIMALIPTPFQYLIEDISALGSVSLNAQATGRYSSAEMPIVTGNIKIEDLSAKTDLLPVNVDAAEAELEFRADLNDNTAEARIIAFSANSGRATAAVTGKVSHILEDPAFDLELDFSANIEELMASMGSLLPDSLDVHAKGKAKLDAKVSGRLSHITDNKYDKLTAVAELDFQGLGVIYEDFIKVDSPELSLGLSLNGGQSEEGSRILDIKELANPKIGASLSFSSLDIFMGSTLTGTADRSGFRVGLSELPTGDTPLALFCDFDIGALKAQTDTMSIDISAPHGTVAMLPSYDENKQGRYLCAMASKRLYANMGSAITLDADSLSLGLSAERDSGANNILEQWSPELGLDFKGAIVNTCSVEDVIKIPSIHMAFKNDTIQLYESSIVLGNSDFSLSGVISEISEYLNDTGLLTADLDFVSSHADIDQLLGYVSGFGGADTVSTEGSEVETSLEADTLAYEGDPFMVPLGVDVTLNTQIDHALAFGNTLNNVGGEVTVKDGVAIIRQLGFTSDAAKMQLTAMYKSPRKNHLFAGLDFHLVDIEIDKLIQMIPQVDSIMPMLKSFAGQAEFHLGVETNLNSRYELKKSTLLGAATIEGKNLVVLDSETFDRIADLLMFKKSQKNVIDSLMVDVTVFRNEVDIYPFLLSIDKYKLILSGRHNLDMSFNYHLDCLSPVRLGVDVKGRIGDLKIGLSSTRYKDLFVPERRNDLQERTIKLMELINSSLKENVVL